MSTERNRRFDDFYLTLIKAESFTEFAEMMAQCPDSVQGISRLGIADFIVVVETMVQLHHNEFFTSMISPMLLETKRKRLEHISDFFDVSPAEPGQLITTIKFRGKSAMHELGDETALAAALKNLVQSLHDEKPNQARVMSVLGSHLNRLFFTRLHYVKADMIADIAIARERRQKAEELLRKAETELRNVKDKLGSKQARLEAVRDELERSIRACTQQEHLLKKQKRTIADLKSKIRLQQKALDKLKKKTTTFAALAAEAEVKQQHMECEYKALKRDLKELFERDDYYFHSCLEEVISMQDGLNAIKESLASTLAQLKEMAENSEDAPDTEQLLSALSVNMHSLNTMSQRIVNVIQLIRDRNDSLAVENARGTLAIVCRSTINIGEATRVLEVADQVRRNFITKLDQLSIRVSEERAEQVRQDILAGRYQADPSALKSASLAVRAELKKAKDANTQLLDTTTRLEIENHQLRAGQHLVITSLKTVSAKLATVQNDIVAITKEIARIEKSVEMVQEELTKLSVDLIAIEDAVYRLTGTGDVVALREQRLMRLFEVDHLSAKASLELAVEGVLDYLKSECANQKLFVRKAVSKRQKLEQLLNGEIGVRESIALISTPQEYLILYRQLRQICLENRSFMQFGRTHLASTPSAVVFDGCVDYETRRALDNYRRQEDLVKHQISVAKQRESFWMSKLTLSNQRLNDQQEEEERLREEQTRLLGEGEAELVRSVR